MRRFARYSSLLSKRGSAATLAVALVALGLEVVVSAPASAGSGCVPSGGFNTCVLFSGTDAGQSFSVPKGVTSVGARLAGAGGGGGTFDSPDFGGQGGSTTGTVAVIPGEVLTVSVGTSTYGGGAGPGIGTRGTGGRGGGLSGLWVGAAFGENPILIAGGGGGASGAGASSPLGGLGGGTSGGNGAAQDGELTGGGGGGQLSGGSGGPSATDGNQYQGGNGGPGADGGGGGGGGWYGGGGGGGQANEGDNNNDGGGGGGSGFVGGPGVTDASTTLGTGALANDNGTVVIEWVAPAPVITAPANLSTTADSTPTVSGTGVPGTDLSLSVDGNAVTCAEASPVVVALNGSWSCTPTTPLAAGPHPLVASQSDPALPDAVYPSSDTVTFTVFFALPGAPVITAPADGAHLKDNTPTINGTGEPGATVDVKDKNGTRVCLPGPIVSVGGTWTCTPTIALPDGPNSFTPTQTNVAGPSPEGVTVDVVVDTTAPLAPVIDDPSDGDQISDPSPTITGTGEVGDTIQVRNGGEVGLCDPVAVVAGDGTWTCTLTVELPDGDQTFTPTATDPAGNVSPAGDPVTVTIDTVPPAAPIVTAPKNGTVIDSGQPNPPITGVSSEFGDLIFVVDGGETLLCIAEVESDGTWSCTPPTPLATGTHELSIYELDEAGNISAPSSLELIKRSVANLSITSTVSAATVVVGATVTINVTVTNAGPDTETAAKVTDPISGSLQFTSATASQGSYDSATGIWSVGTLPAGQSQTLSITATGHTPGNAIVDFIVSGAQTDTTTTNNATHVTVSVTAPILVNANRVTALPNTGYNLIGGIGLGAILLLLGCAAIGASRRRDIH